MNEIRYWDGQDWVSLKGEAGESIIGEKGDSIQGPKGDRGDVGPRGERGPRPDHQWRGAELAFEKPDGSWGRFTDLRGPAGPAGETKIFHTGGGGSMPAPSPGGESNVFVQDTEPNTNLTQFLWIQSGLGAGGDDLTFWVASP